MAAAVEDLRYLQADYNPGREGFLLPVSRETSFPPGTFLDTLNPLLPRPSVAELGSTLDISVLKPSMCEIYRLAGDPELRQALKGKTAFSEGSKADIFSNFGNEQVVIEESGDGIVEAGENVYLDPRDMKNYRALPLWGSRKELSALYYDLNNLVEQGKFPTHTLHSHPPESIAFPSTHDLLIFLMQRRKGENTPLINAMTILGPGVQVTGIRTSDSPRPVPDKTMWRTRDLWKKRCKEAEEIVSLKWQENGQLLHNEVDGREEAQYYYEVQLAEDRVVGAIAQELGVQFFISTDMETAHVMPPEEIIRILREQQAEDLRAA